MASHNKYSFKQLRKYYLVVLGNKCVICGSIHDLEIHHKNGLLASALKGASLKRKRMRCSYSFYFKELDISLSRDNLELQCRTCHQRLHKNPDQTTLERWF